VKTRVKGNRVLNLAVKKLEQNFWTVSKCERTGRFIKEKDLFGLFDLVAVNGRFVVFVQVTCNRPHSHKGFVKFSADFPLWAGMFQQWVHHDRKGWVVYSYYKGKKTKEDFRKK